VQAAAPVPSLALFPIVNLTSGDGAIFSSTLAITGNAMFTYLEGCFHLVRCVLPTWEAGHMGNIL
jgi:hypothetical protein